MLRIFHGKSDYQVERGISLLGRCLPSRATDVAQARPAAREGERATRAGRVANHLHRHLCCRL